MLPLSSRIAWSLAGGVAIPFCHVFVSLLIEQFLPLRFRDALFFPFAWPRAIYFLFASEGHGPPLSGESELPRVLFIIACNVLLYGAITYFILPTLPALGKPLRPFR